MCDGFFGSAPACTGWRTRRRFSWALLAPAAVAATALVVGCAAQYIVSVAQGEAQLLASAVPIEQALDDPTLSDEERQKLGLIIQARDYGAQVIGLNLGDSYRTFANLHGQPLAWNLSASQPDSFDPYVWYLPVVGPTPVLGFFSFDQAIAERDRVAKLGYDTLVYEVDAFSTLGLLPDPMTSAVLQRDTVSLVDTVFHEMLHNTIYTANDLNFDESAATFTGRAAALDFLAQEFGADAPILQQARESYEDTDRFNAFLSDLMDRLNVLYDSDASREDKLAGRKPIFDDARARFASDVLPLMHDQAGYAAYKTLPMNNAFLLLNVRYNDGLDVFNAIYELTGENWGQTLQLFSQAAADPAPLDYLRGVLGQSQ